MSDGGAPILIETPAEREKRERTEKEAADAAYQRLLREKKLGLDRALAITSIVAAGFLIWQNVGIISYEDIFGRPRCWEFCYQYFPAALGFSECVATDQKWREHDRACPQ